MVEVAINHSAELKMLILQESNPRQPAFENPDRLVHLLSNNEHYMYMLIAWDPSIVRCYEQYALPLKTTLDIANQLGIAHPVYQDTQVPRVQTIDFYCIRDDGSIIAFPVKEASALTNQRTNEKLAIQEAYCRINDIDYQVRTSDLLRSEFTRNLKRIYRHATISPILNKVFKVWYQNFIGSLSADRHNRASTILEQSSYSTGINYQQAAQFLYHAIWVGKLSFNWEIPLTLELPASDLGIRLNE